MRWSGAAAPPGCPARAGDLEARRAAAPQPDAPFLYRRAPRTVTIVVPPNAWHAARSVPPAAPDPSGCRKREPVDVERSAGVDEFSAVLLDGTLQFRADHWTCFQ